MYGSDAPYAAEPSQFQDLNASLQEANLILNNNIDKDSLTVKLKDMKHVFEKSIVAKRDLKQGDVITKDDLAYKKPGGGIKPSKYKFLIGKVLLKDLETDDMILEKYLKI